MVTSTACLKAVTSNCPLEPRNFIKFSEARLHAVSSRNMYSEQGFEALMRAVFFDVCHRLMVVSLRRSRHAVRYDHQSVAHIEKHGAHQRLESLLRVHVP